MHIESFGDCYDEAYKAAGLSGHAAPIQPTGSRVPGSLVLFWQNSLELGNRGKQQTKMPDKGRY